MSLKICFSFKRSIIYTPNAKMRLETGFCTDGSYFNKLACSSKLATAINDLIFDFCIMTNVNDTYLKKCGSSKLVTAITGLIFDLCIMTNVNDTYLKKCSCS